MESVIAPESVGPDNSDALTLIRDLYNDARKQKRKLLPTWNRYYRMVRNKTWSETRPNWMPAPSSSDVFPTVDTLIAWMTDSRPRMFTSPTPILADFPVPPDPEVVAAKSKDMQAILDSWWIVYGLQTQVEMALWDCFTFGCGIFKTGWDADLSSGEGDAFMRRIDPYAWLPDPECASHEDIRYGIEVREVPMFEIYRRFPDRARLVTPEGTADVDTRPKVTQGFELVSQANLGATGVTGAFPGTSTPGIPPLFGPPGAGNPDHYTETVLLKELWVRNTKRATIPVVENGQRQDDVVVEIPYWQMICEAGGVILNDDTSNPFDHGQLPYQRLPMVENGEYWSIPLVEHLAPVQIAQNRLLAALQTNAEITGNPILLEPAESGINRTKIINRPGGRLTANANSISHIRFLDPPSMQPVLIQLLEYYQALNDRISGISAVARGASLRRREPASAVDAVQEASFVRVRKVLRNMEEALRRAGEQTVANIVQFYLEPRAVPIVGPSGSNQYIHILPSHFYMEVPETNEAGEQIGMDDIPLKFDVWMEAGSSLPISRAAKSAEIDALFGMGVVDPETVLEIHDIPNRTEILQRQKEAAKQAAVQEAVTGRPPPGHRMKP